MLFAIWGSRFNARFVRQRLVIASEVVQVHQEQVPQALLRLLCQRRVLQSQLHVHRLLQ